MTENSNKAAQAGQATGQERLTKPLKLELRQGCLDKAALGGLEAYVRRWAPTLAAAFAGYAASAPATRRRVVEHALAALQATPELALEEAQGSGLASGPPSAVVLAGIPSGHGLEPGDPVTKLASLGPKRGAVLRSLGISSIADLLLHTPRSWQDRSRLKTVSQLVAGETATIQGRVLSSVNFRTRSRMTITEVAVQDASGTCSAVYFNQPFQQRRFKQGELVVLSGKPVAKGRSWQLQNPEAEVLPEGGEEALVHTGRIVPLYALAKELSQRVFRSAVWQALPVLAALPEALPPALRLARHLGPTRDALRCLHFPDRLDQLEPARQRLAFEELMLLSLALEEKKRREQAVAAPVLQGQGLPAKLMGALPFALTQAQLRVWGELRADLGRSVPMRRLVQGDVGSGKTVLAALALAAAVGDGWQGALMAPTEILAEQHLRNLRRMLEPLGVEVLSLTQAQKGKGRKEVLAHLASGQPLVAVGTQALIQDGVEFGRLGLVVVDEQHRFGVRQRLTLSKKAAEQPHAMVMTATPIPRTLAMTAYGDLDVSVVDALPPGRSPIATHWVRSKDHDQVWANVHAELAAGRQAYVVVPLVDESDKAQWQAATTLVEELREDVFAGLRVELLHGRMKSEEKEAVMDAFGKGQIKVLCATTVVEVGVDVPNATVMVIEDADRFGLAQLHQLRGRVGRGTAQSHCWLVGDPKTDEGLKRLHVMASTTDGFVIAEEDLKLRGPGEILGTRQSGLPELRQADLLRDGEILVEARQAAHALELEDPGLRKAEHSALKDAVASRFGVKLELGSVG